MSARIYAVTLGLLLLLSVWKPTARFGVHGELGRIDALSIHGLSHGHVDGLGDVPHVALSLLVFCAAGLGVFGHPRAPDVAAAGAVALGVLVAARTLSRAEIALVPDWGLPALLALCAVGCRWLTLRYASA